MPALSLRPARIQTQRQAQRLAFRQFVTIEHSEWLEPDNEEFASKLHSEMDRNDFLEARETTRASVTSSSQWRKREGYASVSRAPRVDLTEQHYSMLQNQAIDGIRLRSRPLPGQSENDIGHPGLTELLLSQLRDARLDGGDLNFEFGEFLIEHFIGRFGSLTAPISTVVCSFEELGGSCTPADGEVTLRQIQQFDPPGVGARDETERLHLILHRATTDPAFSGQFDPPLRRVPELRSFIPHMSLLKHHDFDELARRLGVSIDVVVESLEELRRVLRFNPFDRYADRCEPIVPDIVFSVASQGEITYEINIGHGPHVHVPEVYQSVRLPRNRTERFNRAQQLVSALEGRYEILESIALALIEFQGDFIRFGKQCLRPLLQKTLADKIGRDDSVVSRVLNGGPNGPPKRIETPHGLFLARDFITKEIAPGSGITQAQFRVFVATVIARELPDAPLTDEQIRVELKGGFGISVARETVKEHRNRCSIPSSRKRKRSFAKCSARLRPGKYSHSAPDLLCGLEDIIRETEPPNSEEEHSMTIYLDTARMGRCCNRAQLAVTDFVRFHTEEGSSVYFDDFLRRGMRGSNVELRNHYPGLRDWLGIRGLKGSLRRLSGAPAGSDILFTSSSAQLLRIALKALFERCKNVLTLDIAWPDYQNSLRNEAVASGRRVSELAIRDQVLEFGVTKEQLMEQIIIYYAEQGCDGLFLPAVTNLGVRFPYREIIQTLRNAHLVNFVVVDGAQEFCHIPTDLAAAGADLYVTGCHKWMQAYLPMRLGFCCRHETQGFMKDVCEEMLERRRVDDPLLRFTRQLDSDDFDPFTETANLLPLFACAAAVAGQLNVQVYASRRLEYQFENGRQLDVLSADTSWRTLFPGPEFRSGVVLMQHQDPSVRGLEPDRIRSQFRDRGVTLSAYERGIIRLSMPTRPWSAEELHVLHAALMSFNEARANSPSSILPAFEDSRRIPLEGPRCASSAIVRCGPPQTAALS